MRISTEIGSIAKYTGEEQAVRLVAAAGFDCYDFSMFKMAEYNYTVRDVIENGHPLHGSAYLKFAKHIRHVAQECGITCNQSHAPFPVACPAVRDMLKRAIECTAVAGGCCCVIHPDNNLSAERNAEMYLELLPFARECGVKIACENMWCWDSVTDTATFAACCNPDDFLAHLRAVNDPFFVACLDLGHAEMRGLGTSAPEMIRALGPHLQALHMHDNDRWHDSHQIPFSMQIDFAAIMRALHDVDYKGDFTLEADRYLSSCQGDDPARRVRELADVARRLVALWEQTGRDSDKKE